jgi:hypothetical protein
MVFTGTHLEFFRDPYMTEIVGNPIPFQQLQVLELGLKIKRNNEDGNESQISFIKFI